MIDIAMESGVEIELWRSFSSLLRAYSAAKSLSGIEHHYLSNDEKELKVHAAGRTLTVRYYFPARHGLWSITKNGSYQKGDFQLAPNGSIILEGLEQEMDHVAIELVAKLTAAGVDQ